MGSEMCIRDRVNDEHDQNPAEDHEGADDKIEHRQRQQVVHEVHVFGEAVKDSAQYQQRTSSVKVRRK